MPEYLSPGVFIEEVPARLKAIEGVSTSTVGLAGVAERGPVPGYPLPFNPETGPDDSTLVLPEDPTPAFVTSYGEFRRLFGGALPLPDPNGHAYLERAVRAFFNNGGKRCYISRVVHDPNDNENTSTRGILTIHQGAILKLVEDAPAGATNLILTSLRNVSSDSTGGANVLHFFDRTSGSAVDNGSGNPLVATVESYDTTDGTVSLSSVDVLSVPLLATEVFIRPGNNDAIPHTGPRFHARTPGRWSEGLKVLISNVDRAAVPILGLPSDTATEIRVQAIGSFYRGAIVEIDHGDRRSYHEVIDILPSNRLQLADTLGTPVGTNGFARTVEIDVRISDESGAEPTVETFRSLTWNPRPQPAIRRRYYASVINAKSRLVYIQPPEFQDLDGTPLPGSENANAATQPMTSNGFEVGPVADGIGADNFVNIVDTDYVGTNLGPGNRTGIQALADIEEISIIACPGRTNRVVQNALITQCENLRYRFAILDGERDPQGGSVNAILAHRNAYDSSYAGYYVPWVETVENDDRHFLPPSGFIAGIYARTDNDRGVHKAPANEVVRGITGLRAYITTGEQDILNPRGVNAIRQFSGRGIRVWGARTLSSDPEFRYISTRRFLLFLEKSIDRGTQWVVFELNGPETWGRVTDSVSAFLHTQWRSGALLGRTPEQAFFVRCDESTMTADDIENGRLICNIGVAIIKPAEFVIFRIEQISALANAV